MAFSWKQAKKNAISHKKLRIRIMEKNGKNTQIEKTKLDRMIKNA